MPTINPNLIPTIEPGQIFSRFTTDSTISVRYICAADPVYFDVYNRPIADVVVRQLILAKALDILYIRLAFMAHFPFLITPVITSSTAHELPANWIWDMHVSEPAKWKMLRLAKIKRVSGHNPGGSETTFTGRIRFVFTATTSTSTSETALFEADYQIDSVLTYQVAEITNVLAGEEPVVIDPAEADTLAGYVIFRTLDVTDVAVQDFLTFVAPPAGTEGSGGEYPVPSVFELDDSPAGPNVGSDYGPTSLAHGTGLLVASAYNMIPALDSDANVWLSAFNYPFGLAADRESTSPIAATIPKALFAEFNLTVPAGDGPLSDTTGLLFPVWVSRIERVSSGKCIWYFATYNVTDDTPSTQPIDFATLTLENTFLAGLVVPIVPLDDLFNKSGGDEALWQQHLGRGHVVLSAKWAAGNTEISGFFTAMDTIIDVPPDLLFDKDATRVSSFGLSRIPKYVPTIGQAQALRGTMARRMDAPQNPNDDNRYVMEQDQGLGDRFDFQTCTLLDPAKRTNVDIDRYGYRGGLVSRLVTIIMNDCGTAHNYNDDVLPRLTCLLGRPPQFGDRLFDGTRIKTYVIDANNQGVWIG